MRTFNIYLLRHGKVQGEPALYGHTDIAVAPHIQHQIYTEIVKKNLDFQQVVTSPLKRCADLALLFEQTDKRYSVVKNSAFKEMYFGQYDGVAFDQLAAQWSLLERFWQHPEQNPLPNAELIADFYQRVVQGWQELLRSIQNDTLVVCHGGTIRMILAHVLGLDWSNPSLFSVLQIGNQSLTHIKITISEQLYVQVCSVGTPLCNA